MTTDDRTSLPYLIEARDLAPLLPSDDLCLIDVGAAETYQRGHLPGAVHLDYAGLILGRPPAPGLLPPTPQLEATLRACGLRAGQRVIAYDDQANGRAGRLLWTLEALGHDNASLLNGGLAAWVEAGGATESAPEQPPPGDFTAQPNPSVVADKDYVLASLGDARIQLLDARSPEEYHGQKSPSLRAGRIPGALHFNWLDAIDTANALRFKPDATLNAMLAQRGIEREREVIVYCQTHHRSAHSFVMLRHLGFAKVRGYAGSWSEWGNDPALPVE